MYAHLDTHDKVHISSKSYTCKTNFLDYIRTCSLCVSENVVKMENSLLAISDEIT